MSTLDDLLSQMEAPIASTNRPSRTDSPDPNNKFNLIESPFEEVSDVIVTSKTISDKDIPKLVRVYDILNGTFKKVTILSENEMSSNHDQVYVLGDNGSLISSATMDDKFFETIKKGVETIFTPEYSEVKRASSNTAKITIYYPELTLRNAKGYEYTKKGLFVIFTVSVRSGLNINKLQKYKGKLIDQDTLESCRSHKPYINPVIESKTHVFTKQEAMYGYRHSHSKLSIYALRVCRFCLGGGQNTLADIVYLLNKEQKISQLLVEKFCISLDSYLKWESLSGGPYLSIETLQEAKIEVAPRIPFHAMWSRTQVELFIKELFKWAQTNDVNLPKLVKAEGNRVSMHPDFQQWITERFVNSESTNMFLRIFEDTRSQTNLFNLISKNLVYEIKQGKLYLLRGNTSSHSVIDMFDEEIKAKKFKIFNNKKYYLQWDDRNSSDKVIQTKIVNNEFKIKLEEVFTEFFRRQKLSSKSSG